MQKLDLEKVKSTLKETDFPIKVVAEVVYGCNLNCIMCPLDKITRKPYGGEATGLRGAMDIKLFEKICREIGEKGQEVGTKLWIPLMGELFMIGEKAIDYIAIAKKFNVPEVIFNTNGTLLNEKLIDKVLEVQPDEIYFGIDGATQEAYNKIRRGGDFEKVKRNILYMLKRKKELGLKKPKIHVQFIVMNENRHEEQIFKEFWLKEGAIVKIRRKLGWGSALKADDLVLSQSDRNMPCPWLIRTFIVHQNGMVPQCDSDHDGKYYAGNLNEENTTIEKIWLGELKNRRMKHWNNDFNNPLCRTCNDWQCGLSEFHQPTE